MWKDGLLVKLYNMVSCKHFIRLICEMLSDRHVQVYLNRKSSSFKLLKNGLPQGSVLAPLLFNIYISDMPKTTAQKFNYADDIAIATQHHSFEETEETLSNDLAILYNYFLTWGLQPNSSKTEVSTFHLSNGNACHQLNIVSQVVKLKHIFTPKYLGVTLDRALTFKLHLKKLAAKVKTRTNIIQKLANSSWGAKVGVLRTSALSLVYSAAEYCAPIWLNSSHCYLIDTQLNHTMRIISGTIKSTPVSWLQVLSNIAPPHIRRKAALRYQFQKCRNKLELPLHKNAASLISNTQRLKSRFPPYRTAVNTPGDFSVQEQWATLWTSQNFQNSTLIVNPCERVPGFDISRREWCTLNRIRTNHTWNFTNSPQCNLCGAQTQSIQHIIQECPQTLFSGSLEDLHHLTAEVSHWLQEINLQL